jgi:hypothetical protein
MAPVQPSPQVEGVLSYITLIPIDIPVRHFHITIRQSF